MAPLSPQPSVNPMLPSPRSSSGSHRPSMVKRNSSQGIMRTTLRSPGSEFESQPLRHAVRSKNHARVVLPRNHSSGRNLAKLARQAAASDANASRLHTRTRSHEGDTEIRLPGSLDESEARPLPPPMRRNLTSSNLPRNTSHTKLKKNFSHGHLQRLGSGKDLSALSSSRRVPPSPGLRGKSKRPKSLDLGLDKDLHEREVELLQQQQAEKQQGPKKVVGFKVGSVDDDDVDDSMPNMDGTGVDESEWTEESASISPYSTRANTANNSRRTSMQHDRPPEKSSSLSQVSYAKTGTNVESTTDDDDDDQEEKGEDEEEAEEEEKEADDEQSETTALSAKYANMIDTPAIEAENTGATADHMNRMDEPAYDVFKTRTNGTASTDSTIKAHTSDIVSDTRSHAAPPAPTATRSPLHAAKEHPNPTAQLLRRNSDQLPAPALVSNVTAVDDARSYRESPAGSLRSGDALLNANSETDELVSRFIPSTSNGSGTTTNMQNTPKSISFHAPTPEELGRDREKHGFGIGPVSPGSTVSGSSGAATPAMGRSRMELRMLHEKALADMETAAERGPSVPAHVYDRRNETLKSYLHLATLNQMSGVLPAATPLPLGPEIFQGRFKAVNTELKVVQKFRSPIAESVTRLQFTRGSKLNLRMPQKGGAGLRTSKSAVTLPIRGPSKKESSNLSTSISPPKAAETPMAINKPVLPASKSSMTIQPARRTASRGVSFAGMDDMIGRGEKSDELSIDDVARDMWNSVLN